MNRRFNFKLVAYQTVEEVQHSLNEIVKADKERKEGGYSSNDDIVYSNVHQPFLSSNVRQILQDLNPTMKAILATDAADYEELDPINLNLALFLSYYKGTVGKEVSNEEVKPIKDRTSSTKIRVRMTSASQVRKINPAEMVKPGFDYKLAKKDFMIKEGISYEGKMQAFSILVDRSGSMNCVAKQIGRAHV